jgi:hypothetical protein
VLANRLANIVSVFPAASRSLTQSILMATNNNRGLDLTGQLANIATPVGSIQSANDFLNQSFNIIQISRIDTILKTNFFLKHPGFNFRPHSTFSAFYF